jgi:hypothetical protein
MQTTQSAARRRNVDGTGRHFGVLPDGLAASTLSDCPEARVLGGSPV